MGKKYSRVFTKEERLKAKEVREALRKEREIFALDGVGFIEEIYPGESFNVFERTEEDSKPRFYKSAYQLSTALRRLEEVRIRMKK